MKKGAVLRPVRMSPDGMAHCPDCGEYLGDYVNGILYKFGQVVTEPHICDKPPGRPFSVGFVDEAHFKE